MRHVATEMNILQSTLGNQLAETLFLSSGPGNFERGLGEPRLDALEGPHHRVDTVHLLQMASYQEPGLVPAPLTVTEGPEVHDVGNNLDRQPKALANRLLKEPGRYGYSAGTPEPRRAQPAITSKKLPALTGPVVDNHPLTGKTGKKHSRRNNQKKVHPQIGRAHV